MAAPTSREGSLEAPTRHAINWQDPDFWNEDKLNAELHRVYDICHGCRRCVSLCHAFPTLFDLVDNSSTLEVDGVAVSDYAKVVDHCYLCDLCYMTKCPYVPPHEWAVDFPHLMLRAKAVRFKKGESKFRDRLLTSTDMVGNLAGIPIVVNAVNTLNQSPAFRAQLEKHLQVSKEAVVPQYHSKTLRSRLKHLRQPAKASPVPAGRTTGKVALFATCYGNRNAPELGEDLVKVLQHNGVQVRLVPQEQCCGMPKLELGDLQAVDAAKRANLPVLERMVDEGYDILAPIPSCALMFRQEIPLMYPDDPQVQKVKAAIFDPFEYLMLRHKEGRLNTDFKKPLGKVLWHAACHQRVQNVGAKTRELLQLIPGTTVETVERCSGHDGTYAVKAECHAISVKIARPIATRATQSKPDFYGSDCPMAGAQIAHVLGDGSEPTAPLTLLRMAYGLE
jgi:Fe-S oxidoreductase